VDLAAADWEAAAAENRTYPPCSDFSPAPFFVLHRRGGRKDLIYRITNVKKNMLFAVVKLAPPPTPLLPSHITAAMVAYLTPIVISFSSLCVAGIGFADNYLAGDGIV
jgi:hypothetical protein